VNHFNSTAGTHVLDCVAEASTDSRAAGATSIPGYNAQKVWVYGNANDIDVTSDAVAATTTTTEAVHEDAKTFKLSISGVTNPWAKFTTGLGFTAQIHRF